MIDIPALGYFCDCMRIKERASMVTQVSLRLELMSESLRIGMVIAADKALWGGNYANIT